MSKAPLQPRLGLPRLPSQELHTLLAQCSDLAISLSEDGYVRAVFPAEALRDVAIDSWRGQPLSAVLTEDSKQKLSLLLADNAVDTGAECRWRHLNFLTEDGVCLPLLVKFFHIRQARLDLRMLCCRDLRPSEQAQQAFQRALIALEGGLSMEPSAAQEEGSD